MQEPQTLTLRDLAGRPRGTGFLVDPHSGTLLTSHAAVDSLPRVVLHAPGADTTVLVEAHDITPLPGQGLALVRADALRGSPAFLLAGGEPPAPGTALSLRLPRETLNTEATALGAVTYTATDAFHLIEPALELTGVDPDPCGHTAGAPLVDPGTHTVRAVLGTAMHGAGGGRCHAVLPRAAGQWSEELAAVLEANGRTVPGYGRDLNLAGLRTLTAAGLPKPPPPTERPGVRAEFDRFLAGAGTHLLALVGDPGTGRTTELAALAHRTDAPAIHLRGADLRLTDTGVRDALHRVLPGPSPEEAAALARQAGHPLVVLLDAPEEMPPVLARDLGVWSTRTADWLRRHGARLIVACRPEFWEHAAGRLPAGILHRPETPCGTLPPCVRVGDLTPGEAADVRARYGIPGGAVHPDAARHPLALRFLADIRAAAPQPPSGVPRRCDILDAWLALTCLRVARRITPADPRRTAARVAGRVHEAARRCLGPGQGELDRAAFEELFPWTDGLAGAVLAEGLLEPAGAGYRFAHEELGDWLQGAHLDLDTALPLLTDPQPRERRTASVPPHRIGPLVEALLLVGRRHGPDALRARLTTLAVSVAAWAHTAPEPPAPGAWWAAHLLGETLLRVPDAGPQLPVLRLLAEQLPVYPAGPVLAPFGPSFWHRLPLTAADRLELLRLLVPADPARPSRFLREAGELLAADPVAVQPLLARWFDDERPVSARSRVTVGDAATALLHTHRAAAPDALTDTLADTAHPRAGRLLTALCEDEPSDLCRAVDRWAHDPRPARHTAAAVYGPRAARHATADADRELLARAALALLSRPGGFKGAALAILVHDPRTRQAYLTPALSLFAAGDPCLTPADLVPALATHPEPVLAALRDRLDEPGTGPADVLRTLAAERDPVVARHAAELAAEYATRHPEAAAAAAGPGMRRTPGVASPRRAG